MAVGGLQRPTVQHKISFGFTWDGILWGLGEFEQTRVILNFGWPSGVATVGEEEDEDSVRGLVLA